MYLNEAQERKAKAIAMLNVIVNSCVLDDEISDTVGEAADYLAEYFRIELGDAYYDWGHYEMQAHKLFIERGNV